MIKRLTLILVLSIILGVLIQMMSEVGLQDQLFDATGATNDTSFTEETETVLPSDVPSQPSTEAETVPPTEAPTIPPTEAPVVPQTQPPATPPTESPTTPSKVETVPVPDEVKDIVLSFRLRSMQTWTLPLKDAFGEVVGSREFASSRSSGKRAHAGIDFVAPHGTKVYAITSGTVQRIALFYYNTSAVEILNDDGSILRYCEIDPAVKVGDRVEQGELVGKILRADSGTEMLHMEVYYGDGEGMLTQGSNRTFTYLETNKHFQRRSDLLDPTFLKDLPMG